MPCPAFANQDRKAEWLQAMQAFATTAATIPTLAASFHSLPWKLQDLRPQKAVFFLHRNIPYPMNW